MQNRNLQLRAVPYIRCRLSRSGRGFSLGLSFGMDLPLHFTQKTIAASGYGLDKPRAAGGIAQDFANLVNRCIEAVVEIHVSIGGPQSFPQFFSTDHASSPFEKHAQRGERLVLKPDPASLFAEFASLQISFKDSEARDRGLAAGERK